MTYRRKVLSLIATVSVAQLHGCATNNSQIKTLNEHEIMAQEKIVEQARQHFYCGQYDQAIPLIEPLCEERTISQPLYLCELGTYHLARNEKAAAKEYLMEAYVSIEDFFDPTSEQKAISLWGAEAEKVYKGDPYEQATLSLLLGLLLLEEGNIDNALACFKNGQIADSDVESDAFRTDYGLLQFLEAQCHRMRGEQIEYDQLMSRSVESFAKTHPLAFEKRQIIAAKDSGSTSDEQEIEQLRASLAEAESLINQQYLPYQQPLTQAHNTLLLIWMGRSPVMDRIGQYGEQRVVVKTPTEECHFEVQLDGTSWHDVIRGFADIQYQATTRGGRAMDNVLADQATFKRTASEMGNAFFDAAGDTADPNLALALLFMGAVSHGISAATNVQADTRCWKTLPEHIAVLPLQLTPGLHSVRIDCYDSCLNLNRSVDYEIVANDSDFQFFSLVIPTIGCSELNAVESHLSQ